MANATVKIAVQAQDEASGALNNVSNSLAGLSGSVFKGVASWDILKTAMGTAKNFLEDSVKEFLTADTKLNLVKATIESMGKTWQQAGDEVLAFGAKMASMGVDDEQAELSMAKLAKSAGGDLAKGMQLAKLAADLTASGFGTLESNTDNLQKVMSGKGARALMEYKINLESTASTGEQLNAIQKKVTQSTEEYAQTTEGQIAVVKEAYTNLKEAVGEGFVTALSEAVKESGLFDTAIGKSADAMDIAKMSSYELVMGLIVTGKTFYALGASVSAVGYAIYGAGQTLVGFYEAKQKAEKGDFAGAWNDIKNGIKEGTDSLKYSSKTATDSYDSLGKSLDDLMNPSKALVKMNEAVAASHKKVKDASGEAGAGVENANASAAKSYMKHSEAIAKLGEEYSKLKETANVSLNELADTFRSDMQTINNSIASTQKAMADLSRSYNADQSKDTASVADQIVASQQKIIDLKNQLYAETDVKRRADIQNQIDAEQKNYDTTQQFRDANSSAINEATRRSKLTQLQRDIEDYNARRLVAAQEYQDKLADLQQQLAAETQKRDETIALYNDRRDKILATLTQATADYIAQSKIRTQQTTDEVNAAVAEYQRLASVISSVKSASASAVSVIGSSKIAGARASGGPVSGGSTYIVGENGPEMFTPSTSGNIIPNHQIGGGSNGGVQIVISGNTLLSEGVARQICDMVVSQWKRNVR